MQRSCSSIQTNIHRQIHFIPHRDPVRAPSFPTSPSLQPYWLLLPSSPRECLLNTILQATVDVCSQSKLSNLLGATLLDTVLFIWIKTKRNTPAMWTTLQKNMSCIFHFMEPVEQTKVWPLSSHSLSFLLFLISFATCRWN